MKELSVGQRRYKAVMAVLSVGRTVTSGVEPTAGVEPATYALPRRRSTT